MKAGKQAMEAFSRRMFMKAVKLVTYENLMNNPEEEIIEMIMVDTKQNFEVSAELFQQAKEFKFVTTRRGK